MEMKINGFPFSSTHTHVSCGYFLGKQTAGYVCVLYATKDKRWEIHCIYWTKMCMASIVSPNLFPELAALALKIFWTTKPKPNSDVGKSIGAFHFVQVLLLPVLLLVV